MAHPNPYMLIPPGGPSGPFWGVMRQSGLIVAMQIQERETAELLVTVLNIVDGDFDTIHAVAGEIAREYEKIWGSSTNPGAEDYLVRQLGGALVNHVRKLTTNDRL
jgi:hypothetical protein